MVGATRPTTQTVSPPVGRFCTIHGRHQLTDRRTARQNERVTVATNRYYAIFDSGVWPTYTLTSYYNA